jgi:hypothetical protein
VSASYTYRVEVLEELARHGIRPRPDTAPALINEFLNDLYRFEIRRLKRRLLAGEFPQSDYAGKVVELRRRYMLISVPVRFWTVEGGDPPHRTDR